MTNKLLKGFCKTCPVLLRCLWMHRFAQIKKCTRCVSFESWLDRRGPLYANRCYRWPLWSLMEKAWSVRSVLSWWSELSGHHFLEPKTNHCSIRCIGSGASAPLSVVPLGGWRSHYILKIAQCSRQAELGCDHLSCLLFLLFLNF